ncbi:MAG: hypothetical protein J7K77_02665 [Dehalococcoidales bacterium]|nr:hypothetical protein [Dehalococcoidales bacterium]
MNRFRVISWLLCFGLLWGGLGGLFGERVVLASQSQPESNPSWLLPLDEIPPPAEEKLELFSKYPVLANTPGESFAFDVTFNYEGSSRRAFDLNLVTPPGWVGIIKGGYPEVEISAFEPEPEKERQNVKVIVSPVLEKPPELGEYEFTFEAASGDLRDSIKLKAEVVAALPRYVLGLYVDTRFIQVKAGEDNHLSLIVANSGTGVLDDVVLSSEVPSGWEVVFTPSDVGSLEPGVKPEVDVVIKPPPDAEPGDYNISLKATAEKVNKTLELRTTVLSSTRWGGAGIGIAAAIIAGVVIWFRRAGKR